MIERMPTTEECCVYHVTRFCAVGHKYLCSDCLRRFEALWKKLEESLGKMAPAHRIETD